MSIRSEYHPLKKVVVHKPGYEWNLVTVEHNMQEKYLIEDVLFTEHAASDHQEFTSCIRHAVGKDSVVEFSELLYDILDDREIKSDIVGAVSALESVGIKTHDLMLSDEFTQKELTELLIAGAFKPQGGAEIGYKVLFPPIPNLLFTRDIGMVFGNSVILAHPAKSVRRREGLLARYIFRNHPLFKDIEIIDILDDATSHDLLDNVNLEGGDMIALDEETLIIGSSERTTDHAIALLTKRLLTESVLKRVIKVKMPAERATMHLDTVFTIIGKDDCVYYPRFFSEAENSIKCPAYTYELHNGQVKLVHEFLRPGLHGNSPDSVLTASPPVISLWLQHSTDQSN